VELRTLGSGGPQVSLLGLGCNQLGGTCDYAASRAVVEKALDLGVTVFDTADTYGDRGTSEEFLGRILGARRKDIVLATKFGMAMDDRGRMQGGSRRYVMEAVEASLKRLGTDWIDLYQLHRPDPATPIAETLGALTDLVRQGKVRQIGCSAFTGAQLDEAAKVASSGHFVPFTTCQNDYSLLVRGIERDLAPAMAVHGVGFLPYLPLAGGMLTGKYRQDAPLPAGSRLATQRWISSRVLTDANWRLTSALTKFAAARGKTLLELAMGFLAARPFVTSIIAGATRPEQVEANLKALAWRPGAADLDELDRAPFRP
jgi:aryl-alcohol dehydrogenase-like predicted oxidoreductase